MIRHVALSIVLLAILRQFDRKLFFHKLWYAQQQRVSLPSITYEINKDFNTNYLIKTNLT